MRSRFVYTQIVNTPKSTPVNGERLQDLCAVPSSWRLISNGPMQWHSYYASSVRHMLPGLASEVYGHNAVRTIMTTEKPVILVVEDEILVRLTAVGIAEDAGFEVLCATTRTRPSPFSKPALM
jgi:hypothetical protein